MTAMGDTTTSTPHTEPCIDNCRPLKAIVIGAGISGIISAIKLPRAIEKLDLVIYEKNAGLGGTWFENRYPGVACDIPAHMYQLSWDSNIAWSQFYASGPEILAYWQRVAQKYDIERYMRFSHRVIEARWDSTITKWTVKVEDSLTGQIYEDHADALITAFGLLNQWEWPSIPGLATFQGKLMHSAQWDETYDVKDKAIAVIGAGSSGIQIVPSIQPKVRQLDHYVRGRTWIAAPMADQEFKRRGIQNGNFTYPSEEIQGWEADRQSYLRYRKLIETFVQTGYNTTLRGLENQQAKEHFQQLMAARLSNKPELLSHFLPNFPPFCRRLTPGPGYLESLTEDNVMVIVDPIDHVDQTGIVTKNGTRRDVDAIVCATGFNTHFTNHIPIYGENGIKLFSAQAADDDDKKNTDHANNRPRMANYLSFTVDSFPNMFMLLGPNSGVGHGNLLMIIERVADYICDALRKMQSQHIRTIQPSTCAVDAFMRFCDAHFERTVFTEECSSWYKTDGKVTALWPGSSLHAIKALEWRRWEDFQYTYWDREKEAIGLTSWLGDGSTKLDWDSGSDKSYYLRSSIFVMDDLPKDEKMAVGQ